ncbi:MAG: M17 family peptidase N-terminal domain-containing protein [Polyangiales bacterium]
MNGYVQWAAARAGDGMDVRFAAPTLAVLDSLKSDALVSFFFQEERPLQGVSGLVDWRLGGLLSRRLVQGQISGQWQECVLVPVFPRLPSERFFLLGLGSQEDFDLVRFQAALRQMFAALSAAGVRSMAWSLPGRSTDCWGAEDALMHFLTLWREEAGSPELWVLEDADSSRTLLTMVESARRRARAAAAP